MGLDIVVYRALDLPVEKWDDETHFYTLEDNPELSVFNKSVDRDLEYHDFEKILEDMGYDIEKCEMMGMEGNSNGSFYEFRDTQHELYNTLNFIEENIKHYETKEELFSSNFFKEYKENYEPLLLEKNFKSDYGVGEDEIWFPNDVWSFCKERVDFKIMNPPTVRITTKCVALEEVGYQRKGANRQFYEDGMWDSPCVIDLETLKLHHEKYFSHSTPESKGGWGSGVEFQQTDEEMRKNFKENIIDKFVEGETFVSYC